MKLSQSLILSLCLLGATQFAQSQVKDSNAHAIPGTLDPTTGKFTTRVAHASAQSEATTAATATSILFRETFQISIANYDQPGSTAVCSVDMSGGDSFGDYSEQASVSVPASLGTFSCTVPVLAEWSLATPTTDTISASITVTIYTPSSATGVYGTPTVYRSTYRGLSVAQPGNTVTAVNNVSVIM